MPLIDRDEAVERLRKYHETHPMLTISGIIGVLDSVVGKVTHCGECPRFDSKYGSVGVCKLTGEYVDRHHICDKEDI